MCLATVLFPHPAGPVTSQMCWSLAGESVVDAALPLVMTPLESAVGSRAAFGEGGILWRPDDMAPEDDGLCPLTATEVL
jgi:hypothetical protein